MLKRGVSRIVIATPAMGGRDGVSEVTRQYVAALSRPDTHPAPQIEVWSLGDQERPAMLRDSAIEFRTARGSRFTFASFGLRPSDADSATVVIVQHVHLLPVMLPLLQRGARVVPVLHGIEAWKTLRRLERAGLRRAWKIIAVSQHTVDRFRQANPELAALDVQVCHSAVPAATQRAAARRPGRFALIVARMAGDERYKGHDELLEIWPAVRARVPDATLVVVGDGDDRARLEHKARLIGLSRVVTFAGSVADDELAAWYEDASCFVMPSPDEGLGLVYLEAMRAGLPCIAARGAAEEIIDHGEQGFIVSADDREALADAVVRLFEDRELRARMSAAAACRIAERFMPAQFAARLSGLVDVGVTPVAC